MARRPHVVQAATAAALLLVFVQLLTSSSAADPPFSCGAPSSAPFCDRKLPIEQRARDLVSKLTLEEKISQLGDLSPAVARLGVPAYKWWSEALHGVAWSRGIHLNGSLRAATSFPQVILTAASFNPDLWYRIGQVRTPTHLLLLASDCFITLTLESQLSSVILYWDRLQ
jgi:hypothetical protein